ncbi:MAG TPA: chemotaxis protein CheA, partial [Lachnospiraceae bacterium]|nr:chemotaxis protein CheA [Lachnospiraceae bacterium]
MQNLTHDMENVFTEIRAGNMKVTSRLIDVLFQTLDALEEYKDTIQATSDEGTNDNAAIIKELQTILDEGLGKAPAKEDAPAEKSQGEEKSEEGGDKKWEEIKLNEEQINAVREADEKGLNVFGCTVTIQDSCVLKAARAFLVFKAIEDLGEVIESLPSSQDIEDEKFDFDFCMIVTSGEDFDKVEEAVLSVSEIEKVTGEKLDINSFLNRDSEGGKEEEKKAESKEDKEEDEKSIEETKPAVAAASPAPAAGANQQQAKKPGAGKPVVNRTVRVDIEKLDVLMNLVSELIIAKNSIVSVASGDNTNNSALNEQIGYLENVTTNLHESIMKVRMVPIETVVNRFPKMVRDLSKKLNKKMNLYMSGEDTELDRTVVDELGDPLMHLLRNSADHGLETAEIRLQRGKPEAGSIFLDAYQEGNNVHIEVRDDGNGIDVEAVRQKAIERGTVTPEQAALLSDKEVIDMLFQPSFSTAKVVTDVSGRGVGLDVVKSKIEALGGDVTVKTKLGEGTTFSVRLPLTLAIIQALMVVVSDEKYAIALGSIDTIESVNKSDVKYVEAKEVITLRENVIPIIRLRPVLGIEEEEGSDTREDMIVVVVKKGDQLAGLVVDDLIGQQEVVIKSLGKYINCSSRVISGATILGDGEVALILDANILI